MKIKRFRTLCNVASILMKIIASFFIIVLLIGVYAIFARNTTFLFSFEMPYFTIFTNMRGPLNDSEIQKAAFTIFPLTNSIYGYIFIKGGQLFKNLAKGTSPFELSFAEKVKQLSILLVLSDILLPLVYSLLVTIIMEGSYYLIFGLGPSFIIGLVLYAVSEILKYGIELQKLSDDTI